MTDERGRDAQREDGGKRERVLAEILVLLDAVPDQGEEEARQVMDDIRALTELSDDPDALLRGIQMGLELVAEGQVVEVPEPNPPVEAEMDDQTLDLFLRVVGGSVSPRRVEAILALGEILEEFAAALDGTADLRAVTQMRRIGDVERRIRDAGSRFGAAADG